MREEEGERECQVKWKSPWNFCLVPTMTFIVLHNCLLEIGSMGGYGEAKLLATQWPATETKDLQQASPSSTFPPATTSSNEAPSLNSPLCYKRIIGFVYQCSQTLTIQSPLKLHL